MVPTRSQRRDRQARGHHYSREDGGAPKSDLLIHVPGSDENYAVIEVKTVDNLRKREIIKDIGTLAQLTNDLGYARGIHLVFGAPATETLDVLHRSEVNPQGFGRIEFWGQAEPGVAAERSS